MRFGVVLRLCVVMCVIACACVCLNVWLCVVCDLLGGVVWCVGASVCGCLVFIVFARFACDI